MSNWLGHSAFELRRPAALLQQQANLHRRYRQVVEDVLREGERVASQHTDDTLIDCDRLCCD
ncbi:MAG TPA: hypothetical protein EYG03_08615 [Planctomycetes bacterium]|nr:hypothetical protein [Fuerstiella sp.]HIK92029.1 hypothetical protein [Planctomycetota bacterium]